MDTEIEGDGWSLRVPANCFIVEHSDAPRRVERFVEFRSEVQGFVGRVVVERPPGDFMHADTSFALAAADFNEREGFMWRERASLQGQYEELVEVGQFEFDGTIGLLASADLGDGRTATVAWLYPEVLADSIAPIASAALQRFAEGEPGE